MTKNNETFMKIALAQARTAFEKGEFPVGCILVYRDQVIASGRRTGTTGTRKNETDHAEMVALRRLAQLDLGVEADQITLFSTLEPCLMCYGAAILSGIRRIVYAYEDIMGGGTGCDLDSLSPLYRDAAMAIVGNVLRDDSLQLLKRYFSNPENDYWRNRLLARYTLTL
jgi:tRNA(adenine34) deaminase